jgi:hypothetical protein
MTLSILNTKLFYTKSEQLNTEIIVNKLNYIEFLIYELGKLPDISDEKDDNDYVIIKNE